MAFAFVKHESGDCFFHKYLNDSFKTLIYILCHNKREENILRKMFTKKFSRNAC